VAWSQRFGVVLVALCACGDATAPLQTAQPGVVFTYPIDGQVDVPLGARLVVTFSDPVVGSALGRCSGQGDATVGAFCLVGPDGPVDVTASVVGDGRSIEIAGAGLAESTRYAIYARSAIAPFATNLPATAPLVRFTTRGVRERAAAQALIAVNGGDPARADGLRPIFESTTLQLVFSEPLDPRSVTLAPGAIELVDTTSSTAVPATVLHEGIHVSIDPRDDLAAGHGYLLRLGARLVDVAGQPVAASQLAFTPTASRGPGATVQTLRTRLAGDPGPQASRAGADPNVIVMDKPLIGRETSRLLASTLSAELGDPEVLGGPIGFTIRRGQRMKATGLEVKLGGKIPVGLTTGDIWIELIADGGGRIYRNPHQPADQRPENDRAPLYVDLTLDVAVYATDPTGNAAITQTMLGVQATGTAVATDGVLAIETVAAMDLPLLGVTEAPTNLVLELITDPSATVVTDVEPPRLITSSPPPGGSAHPVDAGIELVFDEPVDLDRLRAGGLRLEQGGTTVPSVIESHGAAIVVRPLTQLAYGAAYRVVLVDVADAAGNPLPATPSLAFTTPALAATDAPMTVTSVYPGAPCALTDATTTTAGRCAGGQRTDTGYRPFSLPANESLAVELTQPPRRSSVVRGTTCDTGSVRIEEVNAAGACVVAVPGTLRIRDRSLTFIPDRPWTDGARYRLTLVSGGNASCDAGELCGATGVPASFDPLNGTDNGGAGGPSLVIEFAGAPATRATFMLATPTPFVDVNGSGAREGAETPRDENRAALRVTGTSGIISDAAFTSPDCLPGMPGTQACMYLSGAIPAQLHEVETSCPLPDGSTAAACMPVTLSPQAIYATSIGLDATALITINNDTGTSVMRVRDAAAGPVTGYIIDRDGSPVLVAALDLYMDAPDLSIPLSSHDLHSKRLAVTLDGPVTFFADGRIAITLSNTAALPVTVTVDAPIVGQGTIGMEVPAREMKLQLVSPALRGGPR
jgi:Bacterial Ig-like domain